MCPTGKSIAGNLYQVKSRCPGLVNKKGLALTQKDRFNHYCLLLSAHYCIIHREKDHTHAHTPSHTCNIKLEETYLLQSSHSTILKVTHTHHLYPIRIQDFVFLLFHIYSQLEQVKHRFIVTAQPIVGNFSYKHSVLPKCTMKAPLIYKNSTKANLFLSGESY